MDVLKDGTIKFSVKLFVDDFEKVINRINNTDIVFTEHTPVKEVDAMVCAYISKHLRIKTNIFLSQNKYILKKLIKKQDAIWFYFEIDNKSDNFENLTVKNTLMNDLYQDQTNLFIISVKGKESAFRYSNSNTTNTFIIK